MHTYLHGWKDKKSTSEGVSNDTSGPAWDMGVARGGARILRLADSFSPCVCVCMHGWMFASTLYFSSNS